MWFLRAVEVSASKNRDWDHRLKLGAWALHGGVHPARGQERAAFQSVEVAKQDSDEDPLVKAGPFENRDQALRKVV